MREIVFYKTRSGKSPIEELLDSLDGKQVQKLVWVLKLVEELEKVPVTYFKKLGNTDGIWEVRVQYHNNIFRLLGFVEKGRLVILTNGLQRRLKNATKRNCTR